LADDSEVLLKFYDEDWRQVRQSEDQRTAFSNITLLIASAVFGYLTQFGLSRNTLPLTVLLIVLGLFGAVASQKLYERSRLHMELAWAWQRRLSELHPDIQLDRVKGAVEKTQRKRFPRLFRLRLHVVWIALQLSIALAGIILTIVSAST
jgi:hypothetical protein